VGGKRGATPRRPLHRKKRTVHGGGKEKGRESGGKKKSPTHFQRRGKISREKKKEKEKAR